MHTQPPQSWRYLSVPNAQPGPVAPPPLAHANSQPSASTSTSSKLTSKLQETAGFVAGNVSQRFKAASRYFSKEGASEAPPLAWRNDAPLPVSLFDANEVEAAYGSFRALTTRAACGAPVDVLPPLTCDEFAVMFPVLDALLLQRIWDALFQRPAVDFEQFLRAMSNCLRRPRKSRLSLIFAMLVGDRGGELTSDHMEGAAAHLWDSMAFLGYQSYGSAADFAHALQANAKSTPMALNYGDFVAACSVHAEHHTLHDLFGFFAYLEDVVLDRVEQRPPQKEGFLRKSFGQRELKKMHWSCVRDGFFWYYGGDDSTFRTPSRVLTLGSGATVQLLDGGSEPGFTIAQGEYRRDFLCTSPAEARHWVHCVQRNVGVSEVPPLRAGITCRWIVDGAAFFSEVRKALLWAKREIYITAWFLSPHVYLGGASVEAGRLDLLLQARAQEGVAVYVLLWNETKILDLNSRFSEVYLESLHENIRVMRHPIVAPMIWTHHQKSVVVDQTVAFVGGLDLTFGRSDDGAHCCVDAGQPQRWRGKDYYNPRHANITLVDQPFVDLLDRNTQCRMPWHDVHAVCDGAAAQDVARNFINRWNHHKLDLAKDATYPYLVPAPHAQTRRGVMRTQMLRSAGPWSMGFRDTSLCEAMLKAIRDAEHFIYIENQFFISSTAGSDVNNGVAMALLERIERAMAANQTFRVIVLLPVHPEGSVEDPAIRTVMRWHQRTIWRGDKSLLHQLAARNPQCNVAAYISFHSLRSVGSLNGAPVTEQIYIHSKLLIVDDRIVIVGSGNS